MQGCSCVSIIPDYISGDDVSLPATERLRDKSAEMVMKKGLRISGTVRSPDGGSIEDALILTQRLISTTGGLGEPIEDGTMFRSAADGSFLADGLPAGQRSLTVYARGYSPSVVDVDVRADMKPVEVVLEPGTKIRGQVVNTEGRPVAGARVNADDWTIGERRPLPREAICDADGWFELPDMPTQGTFDLRCTKRGEDYISTTISEQRYQKEPYHLTLYHPTVIEGQVVDDATGELIPQFEVDRGIQSRNDKAPNFRSDDKKAIKARRRPVPRSTGALDRQRQGAGHVRAGAGAGVPAGPDAGRAYRRQDRAGDAAADQDAADSRQGAGRRR